MNDALHPVIAGAATALPPHRASQEEIIAALRDAWAEQHFNPDRLEDLHRAVRVSDRYLARPLVEYAGLDSFARRNDAWIAAATDLGAEAVTAALERAGRTAADVDHLVVVTTTGLATPSLDALVMNRLDLPVRLRRTPVWGLGCAGGAGAVVRAADWLRGYPDRTAVVLAVELCSLTVQREDLSVANVIATGLFGDGAAAVVLDGAARAGAEAAGPRVAAAGSVFYPGTERVMGWDVVDTGFKIVLSAKVPEVVRSRIAPDIDFFLADQGLARGDVDHWLIHTGGPRVLEAVTEALSLPPGALDRSWRSLEQVGNLSSASVLFVLDDLLREGAATAGQRGLLAAMGPGFGAELALLEW